MKRDLLEIINEVLENSESKITELKPYTHLRNDIGFDSLNLAQLTVLIEDEYGVDIFENGSPETISEILKKINE
jgi:acyl carrier protein